MDTRQELITAKGKSDPETYNRVDILCTNGCMSKQTRCVCVCLCVCVCVTFGCATVQLSDS